MQNKESLFNEIFQEVKDSNIKYVFLREKETIQRALNYSSSEDIDIYVEPKRIKDFLNILSDKDLINFKPKDLYVDTYSGLKIDVHCGNYIRLPFLDNNFLLKNIVNLEGLNFLNRKALFLVLLLHPLDLAGLRGQREYTPEKIKFLDKHKNLIDDDYLKDCIQNWLGERFYLKTKNLFKRDPRLIYLNYFKLKFSAISSGNLSSLIFKRIKRSFTLYKRKKGYMVCLMGMDGAGKTTLAKNLKEFINSYTNKPDSKIIYMGMLGPYFLPIESLSKVLRFFYKKTKPHHEIAESDDENRNIKTFFLAFLVGSDYFIRNLIVIWNVSVLRKIVIIDRSIFDQHTRFNSYFFIDLIRWIVKKPDIFIFLKGDSKEIHKRKNEYSIGQLKGHQKAHLDYLQKNFLERLFVINALNNFNEVRSKALKVISTKRNESY